MSIHHTISYIEFSTVRISDTKEFFTEIFGWYFTDYGDDYTSFSEAGVDGGFFSAGSQPTRPPSAALIVLYSEDLETTLGRVKNAGCIISKDIFSYPGGRRFHFIEPGGNELAVCSEDNDNA
ncbi:VOC family protein [Rhodohalobacter sp. 8-1]|uniref:VOC family protein n=1 Tax=Rhodohalobacter sp. 8-1 TaxID=3131972 RepID=UPI0030ED459D